MDWWQALLIILLFVMIGLGIGYLAGYLIITRIFKKPFIVTITKRREVVTVAGKSQRSGTALSLFTRLSKISGLSGLKTGKQDEIETLDAVQKTGGIEGTLKPATPDLSLEAVKEKDKKKIEQQTRDLIKKEAEEARRARIIQERDKRKAEQLAREVAQKEAEAAKKARELEEYTKKIAEHQAITETQREAEAARRTRELEEQTRKETEQLAREVVEKEAEAVKKARESVEEVPEKATVGEESTKIDTPGLLAEVENNRILANEPWTGKLIPFQTYVWNTNPTEIHALPPSLREDMAQAYSDIQLANSIVWLATELGRRSPSLDENYMKLCTNIAARLETITPLLKKSINK